MPGDNIKQEHNNMFTEIGRKYAEAKSQRVYLDHFRKSKLAILMKKYMTQGCVTTAAQEREARADPEYIQILEALRDATEIEESLLWEMRGIQNRFEEWRTKQATKRTEIKNL